MTVTQTTKSKESLVDNFKATWNPTMNDLTANKNQRLVSFEPSNSFFKRHDAIGTLVIQAGYRENPASSVAKDDQNPVVVINGRSKRWYGEKACKGEHVKAFDRSKIATARDSFSACLRPSDDGKDLTVIASYWDNDEFDQLTEALTGVYNVVRNGQEIRCNVVKVIPTYEGLGSYHTVKDRLKSGITMLIEIGFGTAEILQIDEAGELLETKTETSLGVMSIVKAIANDPSVRNALAASGDAATSINFSLLSLGLQKETLGRIDAITWQAIKFKYVTEFLQTLKGYIRTQFGTQTQSINNLVLTGGGAALLQAVQPKISDVFIIPEYPQMASVRGAFQQALSKN